MMKKYCPYCGKKLKEKEICECKQEQDTILSRIKQPIDTIKKECKEENFRFASVLLLLVSASISLFLILFIKQYFLLPYGYLHFHALRSFILITGISFLSFYILGYFLYWMGKEFFHSKMNYKEIMVSLGISSTAILFVMVLTILLVSISPLLLFFLIALGSLLFFLLLYTVLQEKSEIDLNELPYFFVMAIGMTGILLFAVGYLLF